MMKRPRKVLLTGEDGFIGSHIRHRLELQGDVVVPAMLRQGRERDRDVETATSSYRALIARSLDCGDIDACIHTAGRASVQHSLDDPVDDFVSGPAMTIALLDAVRRHSPRTRVVLVSSAAVYGNPGRFPIDEDCATAPLSPYGFHKAMSELIAREYRVVYGLDVAVVRVFSSYGVGLKRQVIWDVARQVSRGGAIVLKGTGEETRDFIHIDDTVTGILLVLCDPRVDGAGSVYNLASGVETRIRDLAEMLVRLSGRDVVVEFDGEVRTGDPVRWKADIARLKQLGFAPRVDLAQGVADVFHWCERLALRGDA